jgi:hypothetical protein
MPSSMGWRDRDYAKWTDDERRRFYGSAAGYSQLEPGPPAVRAGRLRPGVGLAVLVSLFVALGQLPFSHPIVPALHFQVPGLSRGAPAGTSTPIATISGPEAAALGSTLNLHGGAPPGNGTVTVEGSYDRGQSWFMLTTVQSTDGTYAASIPLSQRGELQFRVVFADGSSSVGSVLVN